MKKVKIFLSVITGIYFLFACSEQESIVSNDSTAIEEVPQWNEIITRLDFSSNIILVEKNGFIQEAIDAASPGDIIYIEPGIYKEALKINKQNIHIIGISNDENEKVILENPGGEEKGIHVSVDQENVGLYNIEIRGFKTKGATIYSLAKNQLKKSSCHLSMYREDLGGGIAHYEFEVRMGNGEFDKVRIHRVVRERKAYQPIRTCGNVFMVHGAIQNFEDIFLVAGAEEINGETSSPYYLASKNIDVWGIDLGWTDVPIETTDLSFMKDWGVEKDIDHTLKAISIARLIRGFTRQGFCKMNLLGFSYGVMISYGAAGRETQMHWICRNIKGIIPVDNLLKYDPDDPVSPELIKNECENAEGFKAALNSGIYYRGEDYGVLLIGLSTLAQTLPDENSEMIPGFTNSQAAKFVFTQAAPPDYFHFFSGDANSLLYSDANRVFKLGGNLSPYMPMQIFYESSACNCDKEDVSFDDHLQDIRIPIYYIGAGYFGTLGEYNVSQLTSSKEISKNIVRISGTEPDKDYGHGDLWMGYDAATLVWEPLLQWLVEH